MDAKKEKNVHAKHRQRVKGRYLEGGLDSFEDHQVLEFLLFYAYPMVDTNEKAHKMIQEFGSLHNLFEASPQEISARCGVTMNVAILVSLVPPLSKRYFTSKWDKKEALDTSKKAGLFCIAEFTGKTVECFYLICLNNQRRVLATEMLFQGTLTETPIYPREIVATALKHQASGVILAHNHPGGIPNPSRGDIEATRKLIAALETIGVEIVDHIIVAGDRYFSFSEKRTLPLWY